MRDVVESFTVRGPPSAPHAIQVYFISVQTIQHEHCVNQQCDVGHGQNDTLSVPILEPAVASLYLA